jgi:plastocyanin
MHGILVVTEGYELPTAAGASGEAAAEGDGDEAAAADDGASQEATADGESAGGAEFTVVSHDIYFEPAELTIPANTDVTFILPNEGAAPHNFTIDELDISVDQAGGETHEVVINAPPGEYEFYCNVPGHKEAGMHGILTVE